MIVIFYTHDYGAIECNSETNIAYFKGDDLEATISKDGEFKNPMNGQEFMVLWPIGPKRGTTTLHHRVWKTVGEV
jgi:hypothetical protein